MEETAETTASPPPAGSDAPRGHGVAWRTLSRRRKAMRVLAAAVVVFHMACTMATMAPPGRIRSYFFRYLHYYTSSLRMATRWDMFGSPPDVALVIVQGRLVGGRRLNLADPFYRGWDVLRRVVDARLRKFHQKLKRKGHRRRWGEHYLDWVCRASAEEHPDLRDVRIVRVDPETRDDGGTVKKPLKRRTLLRFRCGDEPGRPRREQGARRGGRARDDSTEERE